MIAAGRLDERHTKYVIIQSASGSEDRLSPPTKDNGSSTSMKRSSLAAANEKSALGSTKPEYRRSFVRSDQPSEFVSPMLSPTTTRYIKKSSKPSKISDFVQRKSIQTFSSRLSAFSLKGSTLSKRFGVRRGTHLNQEVGHSEASRSEIGLENEYRRLKEEVLLTQIACSDLRNRRSQALMDCRKEGKQAVLRMIEASTLSKRMKALEARLYRANQRIDNTRRRLSKMNSETENKESVKNVDRSFNSLADCNEAQLIEILGCQKLEFVSKIEFEQSLNSLLKQRIARLEALVEAKSLILRIPQNNTANKIHSSRKTFEIMRENKNTMTTEKIVMADLPLRRGLDNEPSIGKLDET